MALFFQGIAVLGGKSEKKKKSECNQTKYYIKIQRQKRKTDRLKYLGLTTREPLYNFSNFMHLSVLYISQDVCSYNQILCSQPAKLNIQTMKTQELGNGKYYQSIQVRGKGEKKSEDPSTSIVIQLHEL